MRGRMAWSFADGKLEELLERHVAIMSHESLKHTAGLQEVDRARITEDFALGHSHITYVLKLKISSFYKSSVGKLLGLGHPCEDRARALSAEAFTLATAERDGGVAVEDMPGLVRDACFGDGLSPELERFVSGGPL